MSNPNRKYRTSRVTLRAIVILFALLGIAYSPAQAQTFEPIPALSFTKVFNGANPLPQIVTVTSTGANLLFDAAATTNTGGSWLTLTSCGSFCTTPEALTVTVNASATLAAGTYTGQVKFNVHGDLTRTLTVPVTLVVAATGSTFFDDIPGQLSYSFVTGAPTPPPQTFQIRNGGAAALSWTASSSTADGGAWLGLSATSGTAPSTVTVSIVANNLPGAGFTAGTFIGQISLSGAGGGVTIPVSVTIGSSVFEQINPISFTKVFAGANPLPQTVTLASTNAQVLFDVTASSANGGSWLTTTSCGSFCTTPEAITITVNPAVTLAVGTYTGQVNLSVHGTRNMFVTVAVTLTIADAGTAFFDNVPGQLTYSMTPGASALASQTVQIRNAGAGTLNWTGAAITEDGGNWLTLSPLTGTAPATVTASINPALLPGGGIVAGTYTAQLSFGTAGNGVTIPLSVVVGDSVLEQVNPISFTKPLNGANPLPQLVTVASTGASILFDSVENTANGGAWLQITSCGSFCTTPEAITITPNPAVTLAAGTYTAQVTFTVHGTRNQAITVPVSLTIGGTTGPFFDNMPGQLTFSLVTNGNAPPAQTLSVRNAGIGTLSWTASGSTADGGAWLTVSPLSGNAPSTVSVSITPSALPGGALVAGTFTGQVTFVAAGSSITVPVSVVVGDNILRQVNPISFAKLINGPNPLPQVLSFVSSGTGLLFDAVAVTATGGSWLQITSCGSFCTTPEAITVTANPVVTLAAGTYSGEVTITIHGTRSQAITVPVTLTVAAAGTAFFDDVPGQLTFSLATGGNNPPAQTVQIRNGGTGSLHWTATGSTSDGGAWLSFTPKMGNPPTTVSVSIVKASLPGGGLVAGTFTGEVVFQATGSSVTIPISVTVGTSVFAQVNPISFTKLLNGANPLPQTVTVASTGSSFLFDSAVTTGNGGAWLTITSCGSFCTSPEAITVTPNPAVTLAAGTYTAEITFTVHGTRSMALTVPVTLTIAAAGTAIFDNLPGQLSFSLQTGGKAPPAQSIQVRNAGSGTLTWTGTSSTADGGKWLTFTPHTGTAPTAVSVSITLANLPNQGLVAGNFVGQLSFQGAGATVTIPISVTVGSSAFEQANPVSFTMPAGGASPLPQLVMVATPGVNFLYDAVANTGNGGNWLQLTSCGSFCSTPEEMTVTASPAVGLAAGTYTGQVVFTVHGTRSMAMTVPVTLIVEPSGAAFFDNTPGQMSFAFQPSSNNPPSQSVQIRNGGSGTLSWTGSTTTSDGGKWLTLSSMSGTAPSTVTVNVVTAQLPNGGLIAGTFTGEVTFQTTGDTVSIPVTVIVGDSVFVAVNPLSFSKSFGGSNPAPQTFTVANTDINVIFDAVENTGTGGSWLQITACGAFCTTPKTMTATIVASASLARGTYTGQIVVTVHGTRNMALTVPVTLTVN